MIWTKPYHCFTTSYRAHKTHVKTKNRIVTVC
uniref:Uncharacterized protein n=1 Tax=Arundo donax TaxID=35708 RepID=A0A0A8ZUA5_ARUDO